MGLTSISNPPDPQKKSGGMWGKIISAAAPLLGGAIGALAGGPGGAAAGFKGGATLGATLGGAAALGADALDPEKVSGGGSKPGVPLMLSAADRKLQSDPQATLARMQEGMNALQQEDAQTRAAYEPYLQAAIQQHSERMG